MTTTTETAQSQELQTEKAILLALPELPCPNCGSNILEHHGFYNYCDETSSLCERNYLMVHSGSIYLEHDEDVLETDSHECRMEAYCTSCEKELPWSVSDLRQLDGVIVEQANEIIGRLIAESQEQKPEEAAGESTPSAATINEPENHEEVQTQ